MKKLVSLLMVLCLMLAAASFALADATPAFTKQPVDFTTDKYGNLSMSFRATDFVPNDSSWHFVEPETGNEWTGPQLREEMKARKVDGFKLTATEGKQVLYLEKVPKFMHGWEVYVILVNKSNSVESDHVHIYWYGLDKDQQASAAAPAKQETTQVETKKEEKAADGNPAADNTVAVTDVAITVDGTVAAEPEVPAGPKIITVTASDKLLLYPLDSRGKALEDQAAESLTFEDSGNVIVRSESPVKYWMLNGMRMETDETTPTSFVLKNITNDLAIAAKFQTASSSANEDVDLNSPCEVTCTGCTFTYHKGGLKSVTSGTVPAGATIIVFTNDTGAAEKGYSINGGAPEHQGTTSFRLKIEDNTTISIP